MQQIGSVDLGHGKEKGEQKKEILKTNVGITVFVFCFIFLITKCINKFHI